MALEEEDVTGKESTKKNSDQKGATEEVVLQLMKKIEDLESKVQSKNPLQSTQTTTTDVSVLKELVDAIKGTKQDNSGFVFENNYVGESLIDEADILPQEEWVTFITNTVGYVIVDDLRNGIPVRVPYGKIEFKFDSAKEIKNGKESDIFNISKYVCKSRKELEFLRKHSGYKFFHFENIKGAKSVNAKKAMKMQAVFKSLQALGQVELVNLARQYNIAIPEDVFALRGEIAFKIVEDQILREEDQTQQLLRETMLESEIVASRAMNVQR
jgi:hypothetical protein